MAILLATASKVASYATITGLGQIILNRALWLVKIIYQHQVGARTHDDASDNACQLHCGDDGNQQFSHVICLLTAIVCSFVAVMNLMFTTATFGNRCFLYANLTFSEENAYASVGSFPGNLTFHNAKTIWGYSTYCSYPKFTYMFSVIVAMIMLAFFIILPKGGQSQSRSVYTEAWKMVPWALMLAVIMTVSLAIDYIILKKGIRVFTKQIYEVLNEKGRCDNDCYEDLNMFTLIFNPEEIRVTQYISSLKVTALISLMAWGLLVTSLIVRMFIGADFRIIIYNLRPGVKELDTGSSVSSSSFDVDDDRIKSSKKLQDAQSPGSEAKSFSNEYESVESVL